MKKFSKEKYTISKLKPKPLTVEANKCTHQNYNIDDNYCTECGRELNLNLDHVNLLVHTSEVVNYLETFKMLMNAYGTRKEIKAAQKYFDMIPLLLNIGKLHDVCREKYAEYEELMKELEKEDKENEQQ